MDFNKACCILEINNDFDENELKKAFRIKALKWHPDKNINNEQESKKKFQEICDAHKFLLENSNILLKLPFLSLSNSNTQLFRLTFEPI